MSDYFCAVCGGSNLDVYKSIDDSDNTSVDTAHAYCEDCQEAVDIEPAD